MESIPVGLASLLMPRHSTIMSGPVVGRSFGAHLSVGRSVKLYESSEMEVAWSCPLY